MLKVRVVFVYLAVRWVTDAGVTEHKLTHHRDVSEYCSRRALPSVFLGRHVLDANSQVLHFSRLELPYSCSISVRAESGSNIILVIQYVSSSSLLRSCIEDNRQLIVYEIGETFGGYWGPLPDSVMRQEVNNFTQFYTLQTTKPTTTVDSSSDSDEEYEDETTTLSSTTTETKVVAGSDYIEIELPLVNVSGNFLQNRVGSDGVDEVLELLNEVTPREGADYDTSILPLLQFSMATSKSINDSQITTEKFKINSQYHTGFYTPDPRLNFETINQRNHRLWYKNKGFSTRRLTFKKRLSKLFSNARHTSYRKQQEFHKYSGMFVNRYNSYSFPTTKEEQMSSHFSSTAANHRYNSISRSDMNKEQTGKPQEIIDEILKSLRQTTRSLQTENPLVQKILDSQKNSSVYLLPNFFKNKTGLMSNLRNKDVSMNISQTMKSDVTRDFTELTKFINDTNAVEDFNNNILREKSHQSNLSNYALKNAIKELNVDNITADAQFPNKSLINDSEDTISRNDNFKFIQPIVVPEPVTAPMVKHESWENVVLAAPVMAVLLNQTLSPEERFYVTANNQDNEIDETGKQGEIKDSQLSREKRYVQPLQIKNAIPRVLTTAKNSFVTFKTIEQFIDVQDISHLVELADDEIHGRVAMRYMRSYVGSMLFNICDSRDAKARYVYLFNTSRIVIAISNFTLDKMTLVMTPARVLKSKDSSCPAAHVECQISGARACIDSMSACDGVPNCGAYDIYDEDRLLCGAVSNLHHNVYLAAVTFLAVLLTLLYTVHYWLKRCVPNVSEAFFVYTDRSENILNLETIMQSPNEDDLGSKMVYAGHFFYDDTLEIDNEKIKENMFKKMWRFCLSCCPKTRQRKKDVREENSSHDSNLQPPVKRLFSFTELELSKMAPKRLYDANVQTGDSLEQAYPGSRNQEENIEDYRKYKKEQEELNILKFLKESRSESIQSFPVSEKYKSIDNVDRNLYYNDTIHEEKELASTVYEAHGTQARRQEHFKVVTRGDVHSEKHEPSLPKRLRFDEEATTIPSTHTDEEIVGEEKNSKTQVVLGTEKLRYADSAHDIEEQESGSGREFMRFWTGKGKKTKKKKRIVLH